jgi:GNAT superfamily N-acetyltransferase
MRAIHTPSSLPDDPLFRWTAQGLPASGAARAWTSEDGRALAVAGPDLSRYDRLAVRGPAEALVPLVREALAEVGPSYRPFGDRPAITALVAAGVSGLAWAGDFGWMDRTGGGAGDAGGTKPDGKAAWLSSPADDLEITELLRTAFPSSYAVPGAPGVERWAGTRDDTGRLTAVAALAWSATEVGFLAGIGVHPEARGQGLGRTVCRFVLAEALSRHGSAALMVDDDNGAAISLYRALGLRYRPVSAAAMVVRD